jgi:hypothetical protein
MNVAAGKDLFRAYGAATVPTGLAFPARNDRWDDDVFSLPELGPGSRLDNGATDLVAQREREGVAGGDSVVQEAQIGVANPAARYLYEDFSWPGEFFSFFPDQRLGGTVGHPGSKAHLLYLQQFAEIGKTILLYLYKAKRRVCQGQRSKNWKRGRPSLPPL